MRLKLKIRNRAFGVDADAVLPFGKIAIHAEDGEAEREPLPDQPAVEIVASGVISPEQFHPMFRSVIVDVVYGQEIML
ncbi:MAG: hypothetical protein LYZ70_01620 [Nitrososphaerales archaeon]|nr:hypothetical protein [Nitrososphaerales archaeon]